jgi:hypothetical protein
VCIISHYRMLSATTYNNDKSHCSLEEVLQAFQELGSLNKKDEKKTWMPSFSLHRKIKIQNDFSFPSEFKTSIQKYLTQRIQLQKCRSFVVYPILEWWNLKLNVKIFRSHRNLPTKSTKGSTVRVKFLIEK